MNIPVKRYGKVKICHIVDTLDLGGLEKVAIEIVLSLKEYEHQVWCLRYKGVLAKKLEEKSICVREFNFEGSLRPSPLYRLAKELKKEKFTIVNCHGLFTSIWARTAAILAGVPIKITYCHNIYYGIDWITVIKLRFLGYFTSKIIAVSEAVKKSLVEFVKLDPNKIAVIYNGTPEMRQQDPHLKSVCREKLGLGIDDFIIGHIGRLVCHKGQQLIVEAAEKCRKSHPDFKWLIAGDGPEMEKLAQEIRRHDLSDTVMLLGSRDDIEDILLAMDVFVNPSILKEGLPLSLLEAASVGLPSIATDIGGSIEVVKDGVNGFIIPPKDVGILIEKVIYLYNNPQEAVKMGRNSRNIWREKFKLEDMINKVRTIYEDEISRYSRRGS